MIIFQCFSDGSLSKNVSLSCATFRPCQNEIDNNITFSLFYRINIKHRLLVRRILQYILLVFHIL